MKKEFLLLPLLFSLTGCIVYQPGPMGEYGYTYDLALPNPEYAVAAMSTPGRPSYSGLTAYEPVLPAPPVPPVYSEIPDPTPTATQSAITDRTVLLPSASAIREPAGAVRTETQVAPTVVSPQYPAATPYPVYLGDYVVPAITNTNGGGGITNTNQVSLNGTNEFGKLTNANTEILRSNVVSRTNTFREAAGASRLGATGQFGFNFNTNASTGTPQSQPQSQTPTPNLPTDQPFTPVPSPNAPQQSPQAQRPTGAFQPIQPPPGTQPSGQQPGTGGSSAAPIGVGGSGVGTGGSGSGPVPPPPQP